MSGWTEAFIVIAAVAIVMQMAILLGMYLQFRDMNQHIKRVTTDLETRVNPILLRVNRILDDSQDRISSIVGDAAEVTRIARGQAQKVDRVFTDAIDRLRVQVIRADHLLTGAVTQVAAVLKGIKVGLDFIRGQQQHRRRSDAPTQDEELFI